MTMTVVNIAADLVDISLSLLSGNCPRLLVSQDEFFEFQQFCTLLKFYSSFTRRTYISDSSGLLSLDMVSFQAIGNFAVNDFVNTNLQ